MSNVIGEGRWKVPNPWAPAEQHVPHLLSELMYMGDVAHDGVTIRQYKHCFSRRYINLDDSGQAWQIGFYANDPWGAKTADESWGMSAHPITLGEAEHALDLHQDL